MKIKLGIALLLVGALLFIAFFADFLFAHPPNAGDLTLKFLPPSKEHLLGTDHLGRDILSRLGHGARASLLSVFAISVLIMLSAFFVGIFAGYKGGIIDNALMRICDVFLTFPTFILALFLVAFLGVGLLNVIIAIALTHWAWYARIVRSITLEIKTKHYIHAAKVSGGSNFYIMVRHIFPAVFVQMVILMTLDLGHILLHVSGLSFLGLGIEPPNAEWGVMIQDFAPYILEFPYLMLYPGICIFLSVGIFNFLGETLRDLYALDSVKKS